MESIKESLSAALVESAVDVFKTMLSLSLTASDISESKDAEMICTIGVAGKLEGSVSITLPGRCAGRIVSLMLQQEVQENSSDVCDGMCEVANLIAGGVKMRTLSLNLPFNISLPTVVQGRLMSIAAKHDIEMITKRFSSDDFYFDVEFIYKVHTEEQNAGAVNAVKAAKASAFEKLKMMTEKMKES